MFNHESIIIWDWNGTLLNDVGLCIKIMNKILIKRGLGSLSRKKYRKIFQFPVIEYYKQLGFDFRKDSFENLSIEFIEEYHKELKNAYLFKYSKNVLKNLKARNYLQIVISAMEYRALTESLNNKGVLHYFDHIIGLDDHYAESKVNYAVSFMEKNNIYAEKAVLIGDTTHDFEVAEVLGCKCLLIANGHQTYDRLKLTGAPVKRNLKSIIELIKKS
jgi:phosphoglycolate phosphatase